MRYTLKDYQRDAVAEVLANMDRARSMYKASGLLPTISLTATTGAGKTVIAAGIIEALLYGNDEFEFEADPGAVILWFSDDPTLNTQSRHRLAAAAPELNGRMTELEAGFTRTVFEPRHVYFVNTQKFSRTSRLVRGFQGSDAVGQDTLDVDNAPARPDMAQQSVYDVIAKTIANPDLTLYFFLDEAHKGMGLTKRSQAEKNTIVKRLISGQPGVPPMPMVFGISATLDRFDSAMRGLKGRVTLDSVEVDPARVQASGLLKDNIKLHVPHPDEAGSFETVLLRVAVRQLLEQEARWTQYAAVQAAEHPGTAVERVVPLMVLQTPNSVSDVQISGYIDVIREAWPQMPPNAVAHVFGTHETIQAGGQLIPYIEPERVQGRKSVRILLAKEAVTTGWDCPRAEVLMSFRPADDLTKITQTIGRMVRTPLARRIPGDDVLNGVLCLLPYFDEKNARAVVMALMNESGEDPVIVDPVPGPQPGPTPPVLPQQGGNQSDHRPGPDATDDHEDTTTDPQPPSPTGGYTDDGEEVDGTGAGSGGGTGRKVLTSAVEVTPIENPGLWDLFVTLPTETTPSRGLRPVRLLTALGQHLSEDGLRPDAGEEAHKYLHGVLDGRATQWADDVEKATQDILEVRVRTILANRVTGESTKGSFSERADLVVIREAFNRAARAFTKDVARTYVDHITGPHADEDDLADAYARVAGMAAVEDIVADLDIEAQRLVSRWFKDHRADIKTLTDDRQARYADLLSQSTEPQRGVLCKPKNWEENTTGQDQHGNTVDVPTRADHALVSVDGKFPVALNGWERQVVDQEMARKGAVTWYRNPDRVKAESLAVAYLDGDVWKTMRPDFVFFEHNTQGDVRASIVDPHGTHLADALPKLRGLARYADAYGAELMRIEATAVVGGGMRVLDMTDPKVRAAVDTAASAKGLYESDLAHDY